MDDPRFLHLSRMTTPAGLYEHALGSEPRPEHGMCVDDAARALVVTARVVDPTPDVVALSRVYLAYLLAAQEPDGLMHNRSSDTGLWLDEPSTADHWGRSLWAFGTAAAHSVDTAVATAARLGAAQALRARSPHLRAMAYAALGAVQVMQRVPDDLAARRMLHAAASVLGADLDPPGSSPGPESPWPWPYGRLTYANAVLPEALIAIGRALHDDALRSSGLALLGWLVREQTAGEHLSVVPVGGRGPMDDRPGFDQQPIEVAALAEAARTALTVTRDRRWARLLTLCRAWFEGHNDSALPMYDPATGAGQDGLEDGSVNLNQGAESTLAWLATSQLADQRAATQSGS